MVIYSGNMLNEIPDEHIITMDVVDAPATLSVALAREGYVRYTWLRHRPRDELGEQVGEVDDELMSKVNTQLFMVISTN